MGRDVTKSVGRDVTKSVGRVVWHVSLSFRFTRRTNSIVSKVILLPCKKLIVKVSSLFPSF